MKKPACVNVRISLTAIAAAALLTSCSTTQHRENGKSRAAAPELRRDPLEQLVQPTTALPVGLTPPLTEVVRLARTGMSEPVLLAYVEQTEGPFHANAEQLISIRDAGVPPRVIEAMVRHHSNRRLLVHQQAAPLAGLPIETNAPPPAVTNIVVSQPAPIIVQQPAQVTVAPAPVTVIAPPATIEYREALDPYGSWIQVPSHGWCWQPTLARTDRHWQPYHSGGRWIHSNHGWYWMSDYRWGHVAFHYGRWSRNSRYGWVWVPGSEWGPAWVSWRYGRAHVGWAPLPPHAHYHPRSGFRFQGSRVSARFEFGLGYNDYTFCPIGNFYSASPYRHYLNRNRNITVYNQTTVVNNYNTQAGTSGNPANNGVPVQSVQTAARTSIRTVRVLDANSTAGRTQVPDRVVKSGSSLAVYRRPIRTGTTGQTSSGTTNRRAVPVSPVIRTPATAPSATTSRPNRPAPRVVSSPAPTATRTNIRQTKPSQSRTIFVEQVPIVRRPVPRTTSSGSYTTAPNRSSSTPASPSTTRTTIRPQPSSSSSRSSSRVSSSPSTPATRPSPSRPAPRSTPAVTRAPVRVTQPTPTIPAPARIVTTPVRTPAPAPRATIRPAPTRIPSAPQPVVRPATPPSRPRVVVPRTPAPKTPPPAAAPARRPVPKSSAPPSSPPTKKSSSSSDDSNRPPKRP
jgi:hypothetical protein